MVRCTQVLVNAGHGSAVQIPVLQLLGVDLCVNPDLAPCVEKYSCDVLV